MPPYWLLLAAGVGFNNTIDNHTIGTVMIDKMPSLAECQSQAEYRMNLTQIPAVWTCVLVGEKHTLTMQQGHWN